MHQEAGAYVAFEGWVRNQNEGKKVVALVYETFATLALKEAHSLILEAKERFPVLEIRCAHRTGPLAIGDMAVWVGVLAAHREAAFLACQYVMDEIKHRLPIWKKELYADGTTAWVNEHEALKKNLTREA